MDIVAGHQNLLTCHTKKVEEWRLSVGSVSSILIAKWANNAFTVINDFDKSFIILNNSNQQSPLLVNAANNTKINSDVSIANGTLLCGNGNITCGLNYVCKSIRVFISPYLTVIKQFTHIEGKETEVITGLITKAGRVVCDTERKRGELYVFSVLSKGF